MKNLILSAAFIFALSATTGVMAQEKKQDKTKAKTECCTKKNAKDKKSCCTDKAKTDKACCDKNKSKLQEKKVAVEKDIKATTLQESKDKK